MQKKQFEKTKGANKSTGDSMVPSSSQIDTCSRDASTDGAKVMSASCLTETKVIQRK